MKVVISKSTKPDKRLKAEFANKVVHFGAKDGSTFIDHKNTKTKANWEARHKVRENWRDYDSAGALSKHVLWNKPTLEASIKNLNDKQNQYRFVLKK
jgi:hypothetical protein